MAHLALALLLYTGQQRSNVVKLGPSNVKDGWLTFTQVKNGARNPITLAIPIIPALQDIVDRTPGTDEAILMNELRRPFTAAGFGNWFRDRCVEAGVPGRHTGGRVAARRTRMQRSRNHGDHRPHHVEGGQSLHEGRSAARSRRIGTAQNVGRPPPESRLIGPHFSKSGPHSFYLIDISTLFRGLVPRGGIEFSPIHLK